MPKSQLQRGARQLIDQLLADLAGLDGALADLGVVEDTLARLTRRIIQFDPAHADEQIRECRAALDEQRRYAAAAAASIRRRIRDDLEAALTRREQLDRSAGIPARVAELERRVAELEAERPALRAIPPRQERGA